MHPVTYIIILTLCWLAFGASTETTPEEQRLYLRTFYDALDGPNWFESWNVTEDDDTLNRLTKQEHLTWVSDNLEAIDLTDKGLKGDVPAANINKLAYLKVLNISQNDIKSLPDLSGLESLEILNVSYNLLEKYEGTFPKTLKQIVLNNNSITTDISDLLSAISSVINTIEVINLNDNKITGSMSSTNLLNATEIRNISLAYNKIDGYLPSNIKKTGLALDLSYNSLSGTYPDALKSVEEKNVQCNMFDCTSLSNDTSYGVKECMCEKRGYEATLKDNNVVECTICPDSMMANKWVRFEFLSNHTKNPVEDYYCSVPTDGCVPCMFPQNCEGGGCALGSAGPTCETCVDDYRMVGGKCQRCLESKVPIAALVMIVFVAVIIGYGIFLTGLNIVAATMIKQLMTYLQIYYLTMDMKVPWPKYLAELGDVFKLSMLNTQAFDLDCLTDLSPLDLFYIHWTSTVAWPLIVTFIVVIVDKTYSRKIKAKETKDVNGITIKTAESLHLRSKQAGVRRIYIMAMIIAFVPITSLSVRTYACDSWSPLKLTVSYNDGERVTLNQWFYDNSVSCWDWPFQGINFVATMFCVLEFGIVVFLFLILFRLWRFDLKDKNNEIFGALYESFNEKGLFCEPVLLLRKFILLLCTQVTFVAPIASGGANALISFSWLMMVVIRQPYIKATESGRISALLNNWCNLFEIASTLLITITQIFALLFGINKWNGLDMDIADYILVALHILLVLVWILGFIMVLVGFTKSGIRDRQSRKSRRRETASGSRAIMMNPIASTARVSPEKEEEEDEEEGRVSEDMAGIEETGLLGQQPSLQDM